MLEILLSNLKLKNKNLSFALNFPCWAQGKFNSLLQKFKLTALVTHGESNSDFQTENLVS